MKTDKPKWMLRSHFGSSKSGSTGDLRFFPCQLTSSPVVMQLVAPGEFLNGVVFALFLLFVSGFGLFLFGELHKVCVIAEASKGLVSTVMDNIFPIPTPRKYSFNLTHVSLFGILVALLSMVHHPAQDAIQENKEKERKKANRRKAKSV